MLLESAFWLRKIEGNSGEEFFDGKAVGVPRSLF
jgi:hypothetical protein